MRTPKETLERLAEVAPKEWRMAYAGGLIEYYLSPLHAIRNLARYDNDDIQGATFAAFLKKKLREMGYRLMIDTLDQDEWSVIVYSSDRLRTIAAATYPTEWQAVAEAMIGVLENE
jgi:hypothetical protein